MSRIFRVCLISIFLLAMAPVPAVMAQDRGIPNCFPFPNPNPLKVGEIYMICVPGLLPGDIFSSFTQDVVIFAHGMVDPRRPVDIPYDQLILADGQTVPEVVNGLNYVFATTSYTKNGLAVQEGVQDVVELANFLRLLNPAARIYLFGASEGGLVTTLAIEGNILFGSPFSAGVAACGPIGSFQGQINYWEDFRVVFDYYFSTLRKTSVVYIKPQFINMWSSYTVDTSGGFNLLVEVPGKLQKQVINAVRRAPSKVAQLLSVTNAPIDPLVPSTAIATIVGILRYNILITDEALMVLGGQPYSNTDTDYTSPLLTEKQIAKLNHKVKRFSSNLDPEALAPYETSGILTTPLVTMHNTGDPIVPFWHMETYSGKVAANNPYSPYVAIPIDSYGHCNFTTTDLVTAFYAAVGMSAGG